MTYLEHADHGRWERIGQCIYCPCGARLWHADRVPKDQHEVARALDALAQVSAGRTGSE